MPTQKITLDQIPQLLDNLPRGATMALKKSPQGVIMADIPKTKQQIIDEKYPHLKDKGITITDAAQKYGVPRYKIRDWVYKNKYIQFVDETAYPRLINEAEVSLCTEIYRNRQETGLTGVPYFDDDDIPIEELKHPWLSEYRKRAKQP